MRVLATCLVFLILAATQCAASCSIDACVKPELPPCHKNSESNSPNPAPKAICVLENQGVIEDSLIVAIVPPADIPGSHWTSTPSLPILPTLDLQPPRGTVRVPLRI